MHNLIFYNIDPQVERGQLIRKVDELEEQVEKLSAENLSLRTKLAAVERDAKRPVQDYAEFQNLNQKLQVPAESVLTFRTGKALPQLRPVL
jgi:hypothetical protein